MITFDEFLKKSERKLSDSQLNVVNSNVATVVSAGAGSGKTTVLSYRFIRLVLEKRAHVDEILSLTFTKKAASEMYERIYSLLNKMAEEDEDLSDEMKRFPFSYISTLDSFSNEVARTDSARYGISRDFEVLDSDEEREMVLNIVRDLFEKYDDEMLPIARLFNPESVGGTLFLEIAKECTVLTDYDPNLVKSTYLKFLDRIENHFSKIAIEVLDRLLNERNKQTEKAKIFKADNPEGIPAMRELLLNGKYEELKKISLNGLTKDYHLGIKDIVNNEWRPLLPLLKGSYENKGGELSYFDAFSLFIKTLNSEKRRIGKLNFKDIEALALTILKENKVVRNFYKNKFKFIMIDEFQDNSETQRDLLYLLSEKGNVSSDGIPEKEMLDNTKLFFVGDDKQSIYYFRGADVSVFNSLKNEIVEIGGAHLSMKENYRSEPRLIDHFNKIFPSILRKTESSFSDQAIKEFLEEERGGKFASFEAEYEDVISRDERIKSKIVYARSEELANSSNEDKAQDSDYADDEETLNEAENEAEFIASYIKKIIKSDEFKIPTKEGTRNASFDDIAILFRTSKSQMPLEKVLRREGIAYTLVSSNTITTEAISYDMEAFISLLLFPMDKKSYINVLRSPFIRLSDDAIYAIFKDENGSEMENSGPFTELEGLSDLDKKKMEDLRVFYLDVLKDVGRLSAEKILDRLYYESGYSSYIESKMSLSSYKEHYEYLWEEAKKSSDLFSFLKFLKENEGSSIKMEIELLRLNKGGVRLMNIHKSKGLEFPIVILAGTNMKSKGVDKSLLLKSDEPEFLALDLSSEKGIKKNLFLSFKKRREEAENKRLLYVALTRAEAHLVVVASGDKYREGTFCSLYNDAALSDENVECITFKTLLESEIEKKWEDANTFDAFYEKDPPLRGEYIEEKDGVKESAHKDDENYDITGDFLKLPDFSNGVDIILSREGLFSDFGTLLHEHLECYFKKVSPSNYVNKNLAEKELLALNNEAKRIRDSFISSQFYKKYIEGKKCLSEERFYTLSEDGRLLEGSIDLLVFGPDYNLVVDYKSDRVMNSNYHKDQITSYIKTAESLYNKKCYGTLLYLRNMEMGPLWDKDGEVVKES